MKENVMKTLYAVLTSQTISSDGRYLFVCSQYGDIASFNIDKVVNSIENISNDDYSDPLSTFKCEEMPISLAYHRDFLIVGSNSSSITGYHLKNEIIQKKAWRISLTQNQVQHETTEVNDMWIDQSNDSLYAVCGNSIYQVDLDEGRVISKFSGHTDFIHSVRGNAKNLITASEDGTVKVWDTRDSKSPTFNIEPSKCAALKRNFGQWVGAASITKEWITCGGATKLALYNLHHLNSRQPLQVFDSFQSPIHVTEFNETDSLIIVGGECNVLMQYSLKGDIVSEITTSGPAVYSVAWQKAPQKKNILTACGASNCIDVSTNFTYKDATLNFYKKV